MEDRHDKLAGGIVIGLGIILTGLHLSHGVEELSEELPSVIYGVILPLAVSLIIVGGGFTIIKRDWEAVSPWRLVGWCTGGLILGVLLSGLLIQYQRVEGVRLSDQEFVLAIFGTYGAALGLLLGRYDTQRVIRHIQQRQKTQRLHEFTSVVSHDLRNPLNVAVGRLELAKEESEIEHIEDIERALDRMDSMIHDILTLAQEGQAAVTKEPVSLDAIAEESWLNVDTRDASLTVETDLTVQADASRLRQVLENLFRNAVEHGGDSVAVTVGEIKGEEGFFVEDSGSGIPPEERSEVFRMGYSDDPDGSGFGLSIVEDVINAHDWQIHVTESESGGARFEITGSDVIMSGDN